MPKVTYVPVTFTLREAEVVARVLEAIESEIGELLIVDGCVKQHPFYHRKPAELVRARERNAKALERLRAALEHVRGANGLKPPTTP